MPDLPPQVWDADWLPHCTNRLCFFFRTFRKLGCRFKQKLVVSGNETEGNYTDSLRQLVQGTRWPGLIGEPLLPRILLGSFMDTRVTKA